MHTEKYAALIVQWSLKLCALIGRFFYRGATALLGQGLLVIEDSWSHSDTPHSAGLL